MEESTQKKPKEGRPSAFPEELGLGTREGYHFPAAVHALLKEPKFKKLMGKLALDDTFKDHIFQQLHLHKPQATNPNNRFDIGNNPSVWNPELKPWGEEDNKEPFANWWERNEAKLAHLHPQIAEQWIHKHWGYTYYDFLPLESLVWRKESWSTSYLLEELFKENDALRPNEYEAESFQFLPREPHHSIYEKGTWDYPIVVLESKSGFSFGSKPIPEAKFWLIEGHKRFRCLNFCSQQKTPCLEQHEVFILSYQNPVDLRLLNEQLEKLQKMVFFCRAALGAYEKLGEHLADLKSYDMAVGLLQRHAQIALAIEVYNLFDKDKYHDIVSIPHVIDFIKKKSLPSKDINKLRKGLRRLGVNLSRLKEMDVLNSALEALSASKPNFSNDQSLKALEDMRNTMMAHQSLAVITDRKKSFIPAPAEIDRLLNWCDIFIETIYSGFFGNIVPADTAEHAQRHTDALEHLLQNMIQQQV